MQRYAGALVLFVLTAPWMPAQDSPSSAAVEKAMQSRGEEVMVDVVVRDKKGRAITDLSQADFSVFDNGEKQGIKSFRLIQGSGPRTDAGAKASNAKLDPMRQVRLVTMIFDRADVNGRRLSRQAALDMLNEEFERNVYMAVFSLDQKLEVLQQFTNDRELLRKAVDHATSGNYTQFGADSAQIERQLENSMGPNQAGEQSLEDRVADMPVASDGNGAPNGLAAAQKMMAEMTLQMVRLDERTDIAQSGRAAIFGLLAAVRQQYMLPGRKTILYFSEGFSVPQGMEEPFKTVISTANRFNVSFYPIDSHGLTTASLNQKATAQLASAASASRTNGQPTTVGDNHVTITSALSVDTAIESGRYNTQDTLATLAEETGGFLIANTNDFRGPLHKVNEEISTYYEITYDPKIAKFDGSFRKIAVKTARSDLRVQSRSGYFALPMAMLTGSSGLNAYELPLLQALSATSAKLTFPFESGGLHYRNEGRDQTCEFVIDMPMKSVTLGKTPANTYEGGLAYVALVKNESGEVVKKLQGDVPVKLSEDQIASFHQSRFTDTEYFDVPPGRYTIETAVLDRQTGQTSARRSVALVPKAAPKLGLSSVTLIRRWQPKSADASADDPFVMGDKAMTPTLMPVINKSVSTSLPFYLVVYPDPSSPAKAELSMEFDRDGKIRGVTTAQLGAPDAQGRIQYVANAPIAQFEPGNYSVRFIVKQGSESTQENLALTVEP